MDDYISKASVCEILADIYPTDGEKVVAVKEIDKAYEAILNLQSAQPKAIRPKFVAEDRFIKNHFYMYPHCPKCNYDLETGDCYCRVCGCHIDWSEDDER